jgi:uncharacterized protein DUF5666
MNRSIPLVAIAATFVLAACGGTASAAKSSTSPSPGAGNAFRNGAAGQLVQINGQTLVLTGPNGDTTVVFTTGTTFTKTSVGSLADITPGACVLATGRKDATTGAITATNVRISPKTSAGCTAVGFAPGSGLGGGNQRASAPRAGTTPRPTPSSQPNAAFVSGEVTAVSGTSVTVLTQAGGAQTITVQAAATVTDSAVVSASVLQNGQCLRANGSKDSAGNVQATAITITPAGPSGTCTTGLGGGRRGGGGAPPVGGGAGG